MSLDFLISVAAVVLAIGLIIQFAEIKTYNEKEEMQWLELKQVAETAADLLVSNPDTSCDVKDVAKIMNCIDSSKTINANDLAIPSGYEFSIEGGPINVGGNPPNDKDYYSVKRIVATNNGQLTKLEYQSKNFDSGPDEITLSVWRP